MRKPLRAVLRFTTGFCVLGIPSLLAFVPASGFAQQPDRLDPVLREVLRPVGREALARLVRAPEAAVGQVRLPPLALAVDAAADGAARIGILVRLADRSGIDAIRAAGGEVGAEVGNIVSARIPAGRLGELGAAPGIAFIEAARAVRAEHDSSMRAIHVDEIRTLTGQTWAGATGQGAIVAIYDSGIDLHHPDFLDAEGRSRVISAWDQTTNGNPPPGFGAGFFCDSAAIAQRVQGNVNNACPLRDFTGHGTHVAGTAAGDGSATGNGQPAFRYAGVAPAAKLVVVKGGNGVFFENLIVDGLSWLSGEASRLGRPVVVNLSLGGHFGSHDGTRLYEEVIDQLSGPGFMIVISAGNQGVNRNTDPVVGGRLMHARGFASGTATETFTLTLPQHTSHPDRCNGNVTQMSLWYERSDRLRIEVERPSGSSAAALTGEVVEHEDARGRIVIDNGSTGADPRNNDYGAILRIDGCDEAGAPEPGIWRIRITPESAGSGEPYDLWIEFSGHGISSQPVQMQGGEGFDNRFIVASPANATRGIAVAAYATRNCWPSQSGAGMACYNEIETVGDLARFSSGGPRRDGVLKPDIAAPGIGVISTKASNIGFATTRLEPDGVHAALEGTSMSAPHVTGTIAVLYQAKPTLTPEEVRSILVSSAERDGFTSRSYDPAGSAEEWWGGGKLNARDALFSITGSGPAILTLATESAAPEGRTLAPRGTRLSLLALHMSSRGTEEIDVMRLTFRVTGNDPGAYLVLLHDANANGLLDESDAPIDSVAVALTGTPQTVSMDLTAGKLRIPLLRSIPVIAAVSLSGASPHGSSFIAELVPGETLSLGVVSGEPNVLSVAPTPLESGPASTTVLAEGQILSFSANPVRCSTVIFNFVQAPSTAAVYTLTGRRVIELPTEGGVRLEWDLRNADGGRIAPGVYLVVFAVRGSVFREKLLVAPLEGYSGSCPGGSG